MNERFKFGVSYNCEVGNDVVGGADDGYSSVDMLGNDLVKLINHIGEQESDPEMKLVLNDDLFIGQQCSMGGKVVAYFGYDLDNTGEVYPTIVIYEDPSSIQIID